MVAENILKPSGTSLLTGDGESLSGNYESSFGRLMNDLSQRAR